MRAHAKSALQYGATAGSAGPRVQLCAVMKARGASADPAFDMQKRRCRMTPATIIKQAAPSRSSYSGQTERRVSRRTG